MARIGHRMASAVIIAGLAVTMTGCASERMREEDRQAREERINVYPPSHRADLVAALHTYLNNPASIRDAWVTEPALSKIGERRRYTACVRFNAPGGDGRYAARVLLAVFSEGRFDQFIEVTATTETASVESLSALVKGRCDAAEYKRFPELETR